MGVMTVQIRRKGVITIPSAFRRGYDLAEGDVMDITDLGEGLFLLNTRASQVSRSGDKVAAALADAGVTVAEMLELLDQERATYYRQHYVEAQPVSG